MRRYRPFAVVMAWLLLCAVTTLGQDVGRLTPGIDVDRPVPGQGLFDHNQLLEESTATEQIILDRLAGIAVRLETVGTMENRGGISLDESIPSIEKLRDSLAEFVGHPLSTTTFPAIAETIVRHFDRCDRPVVEVFFPEQDITDGLLQIEVSPGRFGAASLSGGAHWDVASLAEQIVLPEIVSTSAILENLDWLNENRLRRATVSVTDGPLGETEVDYALSNERTWQAFAGYEDSGVQLLGESRFFVGLEMDDLFNRGHQLTYQFFTDDTIERYRAHTVSYRVPFPELRHILSISGAIVDTSVELDDAGGATGSDGASWLAAISYKVPLRRLRNLKHSVAMGFEFKASDNNFEFGGGQALDTPTEVIQLRASYGAEVHFAQAFSTLDIDLIVSPGELSDRNSDEAFANLRPGSESEYMVLAVGIESRRPLLADLEFRLDARGQWSAGTALIPVEQLAPGGYDGVRGYDEREIFGDSGYVISGEILTPDLAIKSAGLRGLLFFDYGVAYDEIAGDADVLSSYGVGLRFQIAKHAAIRFDYGWQLETGDSRGHIGIAVGF